MPLFKTFFLSEPSPIVRPTTCNVSMETLGDFNYNIGGIGNHTMLQWIFHNVPIHRPCN